VPIFDHRCKTCGYTWEAFVHNRTTSPPCPICAGESEHVIVPHHRRAHVVFRPTSEIKKRVTGDIRKLNARLLKVSNGLAIQLQKHPVAKTPQGRIMVALFRKSVNSFRAIQRLKADRLIEESWILLRVLLEAHINLNYFLKNDPTAMTQRWADASRLDKLKYMKEVNFFEGTDLAHMGNRKAWEQFEEEVKTRYTSAELHAIKKYGYSGFSVQKRAEAVHLASMYSHCYRIASRSVHNFDPAETGLMDYLKDDQTQIELMKSRRETLESTQNMLLGRLSFMMSEVVDDILMTGELMLLGLGYEKYRDKKDGKSTSDSTTESGNFYIWREES
jgi:hypothetical protein